MKIYDQILQKFKTDDNQLYFSAEANFSKEDLPSYGFFKTIFDEAIPKRDNYEEVFPESELEKIFSTDEFNKQKEKIRIFRCNINIIWIGSTLFLILGVLILLKQ